MVFLGTAHTAIDDANGIVEGVIEMRTQVRELLNPQKQIEEKKTPELEAPTTTQNVIIIEGETGEPPGPGTTPHSGDKP